MSAPGNVIPRFQSVLFKLIVLLGLFAFSIGPVFRDDMFAKIAGVLASLILVLLVSVQVLRAKPGSVP